MGLPIFWRALAAIWLLALALPGGGRSGLAQDTLADFAIPNGHFFPQTNGQGGRGELGFAVVDDSLVPFWSEYQRLGGAPALGYPVSQRFSLADGQLYQLTERAMLAWAANQNRVELAPVFSILAIAGRDEWLASLGVPRPALGPRTQEQRLAWLSDPAIRAEYLRPPAGTLEERWGLAQAEVRFGLPMGPPEQLGAFIAQRFERAAFQRLVTTAEGPLPGAAVTQVAAGNLFKASGLVPEAALRPHALDEPAVVHVHAPAAPMPRRLFAMSTHWWFLLRHQEPYVERLRALGVEAARSVVSWEQFDFSGGFDFTSLDRAVGAMDWAGIETIGQFVGVPPYLAENPAECFAYAQHCQLARSRAPELVRAVRALVARYPQIRRWEFWNEPEHWETLKDPQEYRFWFEQFYRAVKGVQPEAVVAASSFTGWQFLSQVLPLVQFEAAALHPYQYTGIDKDAISELRKGLVAIGRGDAEVWVTEYGWSTLGRRAEAVAQQFREAHQWLQDQPYITVAALHMLHDWQGEREECCFGLVGPPPGFAPKGAYFEAFRELAARARRAT